MRRWVMLMVLLLAWPAAAADDPKRPVTTRHDITIDGKKRTYEATIGSLIVSAGRDPKASKGQIFYIAYRLADDSRKSRPLTFLMNGGPGAGSVFLNLGGLGPKRAVFSPDGATLPPPPKIEANAETWLGLSDLVFIDPVGTGYSRAESGDKEAKDQGDPEKAFHGVRQDLDSLAEFMRLWLTRQQRWDSPVYLVGESYGGYRVAELAKRLSDKAIVPSGIALISPALDFGLLWGDRLASGVMTLPSMAAIAQAHGKATSDRASVETFAVTRLLPALTLGDALPAEALTALSGELAAMIGLPAQLIAQNDLRVSPQLFAKRLLRDQRLVVGRYDGGVTAIDDAPGSDEHTGVDPSLAPVVASLAAAQNAYVRANLNFDSDAAYEALSGRVNGNWDWRSGMGGPQGFVEAMSSLKQAFNISPTMKVWIVHGAYDMVTPYFGSVYLVRQMRLDSRLRGNVRLDVLPGGHMMYLRDDGRKELRRLAEQRLYGATP